MEWGAGLVKSPENYKGKLHSVICGYGTYGGQEGLLEMMIGNNDPSGWHTAEDVIEILKGEKE